ncbi:MAG: pseudouridine synthase [bacterium]
MAATPSQVRINKYLSLCGVTSRRGAEKLIAEGKIVVNGTAITELGTMIDPGQDEIKVDGTVVKPVETKLYVLLNKPRLVMTTLHDPFRRRTVAQLVKEVPERVYPIGRLDYDTEGVLLLSNDGDLAYRLTHPKHQIKKTYLASVSGIFMPASAEKLQTGIKLDDGAVGKATVDRIEQGKGKTKLWLTLTEGRKREVRQLCRKVGHPVLTLERIEFAGIRLTALKRGRWRYLTGEEIVQLKRLVGLA